MAATTWNFPCYRCASGDSVFQGFFWYDSVDADSYYDNEFTFFWSFFIDTREGMYTGLNTDPITRDDGNLQFLVSRGVFGQNRQMSIGFMNNTGTKKLGRVYVNDHSTGTTRYDWEVGDEDGSSELSDNKWYQMVVSVSSTRMQVAMNGTASPYLVKLTDSPGDINGDSQQGGGTDYLIYNSLVDALWPVSSARLYNAMSGIIGPNMLHNTALDLNDSATLGRIYDENGDFKNPGEDGSLWLGDSYGQVTPTLWFPTGGPTTIVGENSANWKSGDSNNVYGSTVGLRKDYESNIDIGRTGNRPT